MILPAQDYVLKCSHIFNVLDARGAVGVTERQAYFGRTRVLARNVAESYIESRQRLEYPWLDKKVALEPVSLKKVDIETQIETREVLDQVCALVRDRPRTTAVSGNHDWACAAALAVHEEHLVFWVKRPYVRSNFVVVHFGRQASSSK